MKKERRYKAERMRVLLADHHEHVRWAIKLNLEARGGYELAGEAVDAAGLLALAASTAADLVLVEDELPGANIEDVLAKLRILYPKAVLLVFGSDLEPGRKLLLANADAFVSKSEQCNGLLDVLEKYARQISPKEDVHQTINS